MKGHCLCGAVGFARADAKEIGACHCGYCRRWGGGPLLAVHCGTQVAFTGTDQTMLTEQQVIAQYAPPQGD
ncbi:hypothetical protein H9L24_06065 [Paenacidovorax monticola]|uniref:CENP-V/GFA domain-containing protein n=1 Tax=Paenacidovorax monticola TaxID=1926868 RepID=A0A7H0HIQ3_9BURK|nr:hypothetical protein H9L24_06065 [Paenacidovorax monticola]